MWYKEVTLMDGATIKEGHETYNVSIHVEDYGIRVHRIVDDAGYRETIYPWHQVREVYEFDDEED